MLKQKNVQPHVEDEGDILNFTYNYLPHPSSQVKRMGGFSFVKFFVVIPSLIMVFKPLLRLPSPCESIRRKIRFFNYGFNYILKLKTSLPTIKCFFQLKMTFSTIYQNSWQCWVEPTTHLKPTYMCQFFNQHWGDKILVKSDGPF
jgi:hypothetical protein